MPGYWQGDSFIGTTEEQDVQNAAAEEARLAPLRTAALSDWNAYTLLNGGYGSGGVGISRQIAQKFGMTPQQHDEWLNNYAASTGIPNYLNNADNAGNVGAALMRERGVDPTPYAGLFAAATQENSDYNDAQIALNGRHNGLAGIMEVLGGIGFVAGGLSGFAGLAGAAGATGATVGAGALGIEGGGIGLGANSLGGAALGELGFGSSPTALGSGLSTQNVGGFWGGQATGATDVLGNVIGDQGLRMTPSALGLGGVEAGTGLNLSSPGAFGTFNAPIEAALPLTSGNDWRWAQQAFPQGVGFEQPNNLMQDAQAAKDMYDTVSSLFSKSGGGGGGVGVPTEGDRTPVDQMDALFKMKKLGYPGTVMPGSQLDNFNIGNPGLFVPS